MLSRFEKKMVIFNTGVTLLLGWKGGRSGECIRGNRGSFKVKHCYRLSWGLQMKVPRETKSAATSVMQRERVLESCHWLWNQGVVDSVLFKRRFETIKKINMLLGKKTETPAETSHERMGENGMFVRISFNKGELVLQKVLDPQESSTDWSLPTASDLAETEAEKVALRWKTVYFMASFLNCLQYAFVGFNWKKNTNNLEEIFSFRLLWSSFLKLIHL